MDRTTAPELHNIEKIEFTAPQIDVLKNGTELYSIRDTDDKTAALTLFFNAGAIHSSDVLVPDLTSSLLLSGTKDKTSEEIEDAIDVLGGYSGAKIKNEETVVSVIGLKEHIVALSKIVINAVLHANFEEKELKQLIAEKKTRWKIQNEKVAVLANEKFNKLLHPDNPYGDAIQLEDYNTVKREGIIEFHKSNILKGLKNICFVGNISDEEFDTLKDLLEQFSPHEVNTEKYEFSNSPTEIYEEKEGAVQTAIRIGRLLFNKTHADFKEFIVLNTLLGGYFGSRLMTSIREDKGYTYGINSIVLQTFQTGNFYISTEVNKDNRVLAIAAIKDEIKKLQDQLVDEEELDLVRNYLMGRLLQQSDGSTSMMSSFLSVHNWGLDYSFFDELIQTIHTITPQRLQELAKKYLNWEDFIIVSVG